ncbi:MAG: PQQ-binding-like beta-propeller repeat protein, partial [Pirellulales bacterium]
MIKATRAVRTLLSLLIMLNVAAANRPAAAADWNQWGGSPHRNNTPDASGVPTEWEPGDFDYDTGAWQPETSKNIAWVAALGSQSNGNPVVAGGKVFVGTNNGKGWLERYPAKVDLGCLIAFDM